MATSILYYSNSCPHSKSLLQVLSKFDTRNHIHFMCIDRRTREGNKTYIIIESGEKIIMPPGVTKVPALLLLRGYNILFGSDIENYFKPIQQEDVKKATFNNIDPIQCFSFDNGGSGNVVSDNFSFLDLEPSELAATGEGGMRQMHNYVTTTMDDEITCPKDETDYKSEKMSSEMTVEKLQRDREQDLTGIQGEFKRRF